MSEATFVYRAYGDGDRLLYVGVARNWGARWAQHAERSPFFAEVRRLELERWPTREDALVREAELIRDLKPLHNSGSFGTGRGWVTARRHQYENRITEAALDAVRSAAPPLRSVNAIAGAIGGRRTRVLQLVRRLETSGQIVRDHAGFRLRRFAEIEGVPCT